MAISFGNYTEVTSTTSNPKVLSKPSGLAEGDLMIIGFISTSTGTVTFPSGWTEIDNRTISTTSRAVVAYKIADSDDVAASTFSLTNADAGRAVMFYLTNSTGTFSGSLIQDTGLDSDSADSGVNAAGLTPTYANQYYVIMGLSRHSSNSETTLSGYAITTSNPTWTEQYDESETFFVGADRTLAIGFATATRPETTATGNYTITFSQSGNVYGIMLSIKGVDNVEITPDTLTATSSIQTPTISGGAGISPDVITATSSIQAPTITTSDSIWTNDNESSATTWTNDSKS